MNLPKKFQTHQEVKIEVLEAFKAWYMEECRITNYPMVVARVEEMIAQLRRDEESRK